MICASQNNTQFTVTYKNTITLLSQNSTFESFMTQYIDDALYFVDLACLLFQFLSLEIYPLSFDNRTISIPTFHLLKKNLQISFVERNIVYLKNSKKQIDTRVHKNFFNAIHIIYSKNRFFELKRYASKTNKLIECSNEGSKVYEKVNWHMIFQNDDLKYKIILKDKLEIKFLDSKYECLNEYVGSCLRSNDFYLKIVDYLNGDKIEKILEKIKK